MKLKDLLDTLDTYITSISMRVWKEKDVFIEIKVSTFNGISNI